MGAWINEKGYSPGSRHYVETPIQYGKPTVAYGGRTDTSERAGPALCGAIIHGTRSVHGPDGKYTYGGLSVVPKVNLMQRNLCGYCVKRYIEARPALAAAYEAIKKMELMSE